MSTRSKEKVVAAFRKLFRSSEKINEQEPDDGSSTNSPSRRILGRHHRPDVVTPAEPPVPEKPSTSQTNNPNCFFKAKKSSGNCSQVSLSLSSLFKRSKAPFSFKCNILEYSCARKRSSLTKTDERV
jgi:hypothetical protein